MQTQFVEIQSQMTVFAYVLIGTILFSLLIFRVCVFADETFHETDKTFHSKTIPADFQMFFHHILLIGERSLCVEQRLFVLISHSTSHYMP